MEKLFIFFGELIEHEYTGAIVVNFHKGSISRKIHKETVEDLENIKKGGEG